MPTAAAFGLTYATSDFALRVSGRAATRETVLVLAPPVGSALPLSKSARRSARARLRVRRPLDKLEVCPQHGADETINYATEDLRERIKQITGGRGLDVIDDAVGGPYTEPALRSIAWRGRLLVVGFAFGEIPRIPLNLTLSKGCSIVGVFWGEFTRREPERFADEMRRLAAWFAEGTISAHLRASPSSVRSRRSS